MTNEEAINTLIQGNNVDTNKISDGYHTFWELYEHRISLFITLCRIIDFRNHGAVVWRSAVHSDGTSMNGWFILGLGKIAGKQITYHMPMEKWGECHFAETLDSAPEWDKHTSNDVVERLKLLL